MSDPGHPSTDEAQDDEASPPGRAQLLLIGVLLAAVGLLAGLLLGRCSQDTAPTEAAHDEAADPQEPATTLAATTTLAPTTTLATAAADCVLETTGGAIAGLPREGADIILAVTTIVDRCGPPDVDTGWGWSCAMGGPGWEGPQEPERSLTWGNLTLVFWRQPDNTWEPQEYSEEPTYFDAGHLMRWSFLDFGDDRVMLDIQETGISFGSPMTEVAELVGVSQRPDAFYEAQPDVYDDPWEAYVEYQLGVFGRLSFGGEDGVTYVGSITGSWAPADFEEALDNSELSMVGQPSYCD